MSSRPREMGPERRTALMETLLAVGVGFLVIVVALAQYGLISKLADRRKRRRGTRSE